MADGRTDGRADDWAAWTTPGAAAGQAADAATHVGDDRDGRRFSDEELDVDHDGDVDMDDVMAQNTENLWQGVQTGAMTMAAEGAAQAQLDAIDAIYGND